MSCKKEVPQKADEYYVKYIVNSSTIYYGRKLNITITNESNLSNLITIDQRTKWEYTIGPVSKGFNANLKVETVGQTSTTTKLYGEIHVSKNGSPFAVKVSNNSETPRNLLISSYTIDY